MKKILMLMLSFALVFTMLPQAAFAATGEITVQGSDTTTVYFDQQEMQLRVRVTNTTDKAETLNLTMADTPHFTLGSNNVTVDAGSQSYITVNWKLKDERDEIKEPSVKTATVDWSYADKKGTVTFTVNVAERLKVETAVKEVIYGYQDAVNTVKVTNGYKAPIKVTDIVEGANDNITFDKISEKTLNIGESLVLTARLNTKLDVKSYTEEAALKIEGKADEKVEVTFKVNHLYLDVPEVIGEYIYNEENQEVKFSDEILVKANDKTLIIVSGDTIKLETGDYTAALELADKLNTKWKDGTTSPKQLNWKIQPYSLVKPIAIVKNYVYNGQMQSFEIDNYKDKIFTKPALSITNNQKENADTYTVTVTIADKQNYVWVGGGQDDVSFTWIIQKKEVIVPVAEKTNFTYDGTEKEIIFKEGTVDSENVTITGNGKTAKGTHTVTASLKDKVNTKWSDGTSEDKTFTLAIGEPTYDVPQVTGKYVYNGQNQSAEFSGFDADAMTIKDNQGRNAGTYKVIFSLKDKVNAKWSDGTKTDKEVNFVIELKEVKITAKNLTAKVGDKLPVLNRDVYTVSGIILPDSEPTVTVRYSQTPDMSKAGSVDIIVSGVEKDGNYKYTYTNGSLTVLKAAVSEHHPSFNVAFERPLANAPKVNDSLGIANVKYSVDGVALTFNDTFFVKEGEALNPADKVEAGKTYIVKAKLTERQNKEIDAKETKITVNDIKLTEEEVNKLASGDEILLTVTAAKHRVHFKAGEGSGTMEVSYTDTDEYIAPKCTFTSPGGKEFDKWLCEEKGLTYAAGEKIALTKSINLVATYKKKITGGGSTGGGSIGGGGIVGGGGGSITGGAVEETPTPNVEKPIIKVEDDTVYNLSKDGTAVTFTPVKDFIITDVLVNGNSIGAVNSVRNLKTGDVVQCITYNRQQAQAELNKFRLIARSENVKMQDGKKAIKVRWFDRNGLDFKKLDGVQIFRSVKRYDGYKKAFTSRTGRYFNTKVKSGTMYYYKVRGYAKFNGKLIYTGWSYKAFRRAK